MEKIISTDSPVYAVAVSLDGSCIICGSDHGKIRIREMETGEALCTPLLGHTGRICSIAVSHRHFVSGSADKTIWTWNADTGETLGIPLEGHVDDLTSVSILPKGNRIVSGSGDGTIRVWDIETGEVLGAPLKGHGSLRHNVPVGIALCHVPMTRPFVYGI